MAKHVRWGVAIPQIFVHEPVDKSFIRQWTRKAEDLGFHSMWVQEAIIGVCRSLNR